MKIIKKANKTSISMTKEEWISIGDNSGWLEKKCQSDESNLPLFSKDYLLEDGESYKVTKHLFFNGKEWLPNLEESVNPNDDLKSGSILILGKKHGNDHEVNIIGEKYGFDMSHDNLIYLYENKLIVPIY